MATATQSSIFTGCGICGSEFCPHGVCRMCHICSQCSGESSAVNAAKPDPGEQARLHLLAEERRTALVELQSEQCPACRRRKRSRQSFCKACFKSLPGDIRTGLYLSFADGYLPYYRKAKEILGQ